MQLKLMLISLEPLLLGLHIYPLLELIIENFAKCEYVSEEEKHIIEQILALTDNPEISVKLKTWSQSLLAPIKQLSVT